jgi:hypothetical protein
MRFLLVVTVWVVIVGGLWSYVTQRDHRREQVVAAEPVDLSVEGRFAIEITPTFSVEEDPFALTTSDTAALPLALKLNGSEIAVDAVEILRGQTIRVEKVEGVLTGHNEILVTGSPPLTENTLEHGIRVKLFDESGLLVDQTVWAEQGALVSGTITFSRLQNEESRHDH